MNKLKEVIDLAKNLHGDQKRKYTGEPYVNHTIQVAKIVKEYGGSDTMIYAAILHDVLEDTPTTPIQLFNHLRSIISNAKTIETLKLVKELTDVFTKENYPDINRKGRKEMEAMRLGLVSPEAQTIKYADLLDNGQDIMRNDPKFGEVYLKEKEEILNHMNKGNQELYKKCLSVLEI